MKRFRRATLCNKAARRTHWLGMAAAAALCSLTGLGVLAAGSCAKPAGDTAAAAQDAGWLIEGGRLALILGADGKFTPITGNDFINAPRPELRPFATQPALAAMAAQGKRLVLAINRIGLTSLTIREEPGEQAGTAAGSTTARVVPGAIESPAEVFPSRSVGRFWSQGESLRLFLYRHPYFESEQRTGASHFFLDLGSESSLAAVEQESAPSVAQLGAADVYAIYPLAQGRLLYQTREERGERVLSSYRRFDEESGTTETLSKQAFEAALRPLPLSSAPHELQSLAALVAGDIIVDLTKPDGSTQSYYRGALADATQAWAHWNAEGALLTTADGRGAYIPSAASAAIAAPMGTALRARAFDLNAELSYPGMRFREPALFSGYAAFIWEEDLFPLLGRTGLLLVDSHDLGL